MQCGGASAVLYVLEKDLVPEVQEPEPGDYPEQSGNDPYPYRIRKDTERSSYDNKLHIRTLDIMGDGAMLGQSGSLTVSFRLTEPECYSLSPEDIDRRNLMLEEAFRFLPDGSYVHKQDIFLKRSYSPEKADSFLSRADARHFAGRTYLEHTCLMHFTFASLETLERRMQPLR